ncbi:MAG: hypothetical protein JWO20_522 [Candidatus Angelobacter sp.]|nr:hypothetical protein [Candidatus Angelobacter sp.]
MRTQTGRGFSESIRRFPNSPVHDQVNRLRVARYPGIIPRHTANRLRRRCLYVEATRRVAACCDIRLLWCRLWAMLQSAGTTASHAGSFFIVLTNVTGNRRERGPIQSNC